MGLALCIVFFILIVAHGRSIVNPYSPLAPTGLVVPCTDLIPGFFFRSDFADRITSFIKTSPRAFTMQRFAIRLSLKY
jgi:hypothetical protein